MSELNPLSGETLDLTKENIEKLKELFPEVLTEDQIDFEKLRLILGDEVNDKPEKYSFTWNGKQAAMKLAQHPSTGTLRPNKEKAKDWDTTENLYIEGDNLEVLKLLQKSYAGKVKVIYIDPPYNTGNDFVYNDKFTDNIDNYFKQTGQVNNEGNKYATNVESNGRFHTDWLNMIYSRLILAKNLLEKDGVIFISIDDHELANLTKICNEIFGEQNFVGCITRATGTTTGQDANKIGSSLDYCLVYSKGLFKLKGMPLSENDLQRFNEEDDKGRFSILQLRKTGNADRRSDRPNMFFPVIAPNGEKVYPFGPNDYLSRWRVGKERYQEMLDENLIYWKKNERIKPLTIDGHKQSQWVPYVKYYAEGRTKQASNLFTKIAGNKKGSIEIKELFNIDKIFSNPKPIDFIKTLLTISSNDNDIILDFFAGSSTTAHATMELNAEDGGNRKFIMVQLPEPLNEKDVAYTNGYENISEISQERIRRAGEKVVEDNQLIEGELDTGFKVFKLDNSNIQKWNMDSANIEESLFAMQNNFIDGRTHADIVYEVLLKLGLDLNTPFEENTIDESTVYDLALGNVYVVLGENITQEVANYIADKQKEYENENPSVVFNDNGFLNDNEKLNTIEILKNNGFNEEQLMSI